MRTFQPVIRRSFASARAGAVVLLTLLFSIALQAPAQTATNRPAPAIRDLDTPRDFPKIATDEEWIARAKEIREQILVSAGLWPMPEKTPLKPIIFGKTLRDGYTVEKVYFSTWPGFYLAGNLYRPLHKGKGPFPAILNAHGHWENGRMADNTNCSIAGRCINFAKQGMIAFSYDMVGYNDTHFADPPAGMSFDALHHHFAVRDPANLLWNIGPMGLQTWNSIRAVDFLLSLRDVDKHRLACTGESGGGTQTFILGAVDDRLFAQAPVVMVSHTMQGGCVCENMPGLRVEYSNMEIAAAAAPRVQIMVGATGDWTKTMMEVEGPAVANIYELLEKPGRLKYVRFDFPHNYNQTSREAVYTWLDHWMTGTDGDVKEAKFVKEPDEDLRVWPNGKLPPDALTEDQFVAFQKARVQRELAALQPTNARQLKKYDELMLTAWRHTLEVDPPIKYEEHLAAKLIRGELNILARPGQTNGLRVVMERPRTGGLGKEKTPIVIMAHPGGFAGIREDREFSELVEKLEDHGLKVLLVDTHSSAKIPDQFANYFATYNRTELQQHVHDVAMACEFARSSGEYSRVIVCGTGLAGLWALLAAPAADAVAADCNQLDVTSDAALLAPEVFCPGIRKIGAFEGVASLAAPHPLLLHNVGEKFPTSELRAVYDGAHARGKFEIQSAKLNGAALFDWIAGAK